MLEWTLFLACSFFVHRHSNPTIDYRIPEIAPWIMAFPLTASRYFDLEPKDVFGFVTITMYGLLNYLLIQGCRNWYRKRKHRTDTQQDYEDHSQKG